MKVWRQKTPNKFLSKLANSFYRALLCLEKKALKVKIIWTVQGMTDNWKLQKDPQYNSSVSWLH